MLKQLSIIVFLLIGSLSYSQPGIYSEMDIELQNKYMDAQLYKFKGDTEKQIETLKELLKLDQNCHAAMYELSRVYYSLANNELAIKYANDAYRLDNNEWYAIALAEAYESVQYFDKSSDIFRKLISSDPNNLSFYHRLAFAQQIQGKGIEAVETFNKIEALQGITESSSKRKFEIYSNLNKEEEAAAELRKLSNEYPNNMRYLNNLASYYSRIGKSDSAMEVYKEVLEIDPSNSTANMALVQENIEEAKDEQYLHAITPLIQNESIPLDAKIKELIPYVMQMNEDKEDPLNIALLSNSEKLVNLYPQEAKVYALRGDIYYRLGLNSNALKSYQKALNHNKDIYSIWNKSLTILYELNSFKELEEYAYEAIDLFPNQFDGYFFMGLALIGLNKNEELEDHLIEASFVSGKINANILKYNTLKAYNILSKNQPKEALEIISELQFDSDEYPYVFEIFGDIYAANNKLEKALNYWKQAYQAGNRSLTLKEKINQKKFIE